MKKFYCVCFLLVLAVSLDSPSYLSAQETKYNSPRVSPVPPPQVFSPDHLKGWWSLGMVSGIDNNVYDANLRWWFGDKTALDVYVGGIYSETQGQDFNNDNINLPYWDFSTGLGLRENIAKPTGNVEIQTIQRFVFDSSLDQNGNSNELNKNQNQDIYGFAGIGFEAFVPFWTNLSIEGNIGIQAGFHWLQNIQTQNGNGGPNTTYETNFNSFSAQVNSGFTTLLNAGAHFYF